MNRRDGSIWVYSEPGEGTSFKIYVPRSELPAEAVAAGPESVAVPRGDETVLVVEDDAPVRELVDRMLRALRYTVLTTASGEEALFPIVGQGRR